MKMKSRFILFLIDIVIIALAFLFISLLKPSNIEIYLPNYYNSFLVFLGIWLLVSILIEKYNFAKIENLRDVIFTILLCNFTIVGITCILIFSFHAYNYSRFIVFGAILIASLAEIIIWYIYLSFKQSGKYIELPELIIDKVDIIVPEERKEDEERDIIANKIDLRTPIINESGEKVFDYIRNFLDTNNKKNLIVSTTTKFNIENQSKIFSNIVNLKQINDIRWINKFFEAVNLKIINNGLFIGCVEIYVQRNRKVLSKNKLIFSHILIFFDFFIKRIIPKIPVLKKGYFFITQGKCRVLSKAETLGRLASCGFEIVDYKEINNLIYFVSRKIREPFYDLNPSYGPIFKMKRIGKHGKDFYVYKIRTMHPYAEYIQNYIYENYGIEDEDKILNDFRITSWGKFMRKFWIDELPMLYNLLKGDLKIVGVRPLSKAKFNLYNKKIQKKRIKTKPGLVPPFYVDLPTSFEEHMKSEERYIDSYLKHSFRTDFRYFFKAMYNIFIKRVRSS